MTQKTLEGKDVEEPSIWSDGTFAETLGPLDIKNNMHTFHMKHDEEMNFNCSVCKIKTLRKVNFSGVPEMRSFLSISVHNKDWHNEMCDACFNKEFFPED